MKATGLKILLYGAGGEPGRGEIPKPNMAQKGTVSIEKTGEVFSGVNISGEENTDVIYQPVYEVKGLAGAVYEITAAEDVITPDGTLRYAKGEVVDTVTTYLYQLVEGKQMYDSGAGAGCTLRRTV